MTGARIGAALLVAVLLLSACGGTGSRVITRSAAEQLAAETAAIRRSANAGDRNAVLSQLAQLSTDVARLRDSGQVSDTAAATILTAARAVASRLDGLPSTSTSTSTTATTTTSTTTTTTAPPKKGKGNDHGDGGD